MSFCWKLCTFFYVISTNINIPYNKKYPYYLKRKIVIIKPWNGNYSFFKDNTLHIIVDIYQKLLFGLERLLTSGLASFFFWFSSLEVCSILCVQCTGTTKPCILLFYKLKTSLQACLRGQLKIYLRTMTLVFVQFWAVVVPN